MQMKTTHANIKKKHMQIKKKHTQIQETTPEMFPGDEQAEVQCFVRFHHHWRVADFNNFTKRWSFPCLPLYRINISPRIDFCPGVLGLCRSRITAAATLWILMVDHEHWWCLILDYNYTHIPPLLTITPQFICHCCSLQLYQIFPYV